MLSASIWWCPLRRFHAVLVLSEYSVPRITALTQKGSRSQLCLPLVETRTIVRHLIFGLFVVDCDASPPLFYAAHIIPPAWHAPLRQLTGRSNQIKKARIAVERELEAQALLQSEEATRQPSESGEESDLEVSGSEGESDVEFNQ